MRFLHCADIHLGTRRFGNDHLTRDFSLSFRRMAEDAVMRDVSAVIICGDFFDRSGADLLTLHQAERTLATLRDGGIEVIVIEGDHDARGAPSSCLMALAHQGLVKLLTAPAPRERPREWIEDTRSGSFLDIDGVRFVGLGHRSEGSSSRFGPMADAIEPAGLTVAMMHAGIARPGNPVSSGLRGPEIEELREKVSYLALGHAHRRFSVDGWIHDPGGLENWRPEECVMSKGYFVAETDGSRVKAEAVDSVRRPGHLIPVDVSGLDTDAQVNRAIKAAVRERDIDPATGPIVSVDLVGRPRLDLSRYDGGMCSWIISLTGAVECLINDRTLNDPAGMFQGGSAVRNGMDVEGLNELFTGTKASSMTPEERADLILGLPAKFRERGSEI